MADNNLNAEMVIRQRPELITSNLDDELVLMSLETSRYFGMDALGRQVWELLDEPRSVGEVRDQLVTRYDVSPEQCEQDLLVFVGQLVDAQLVEVVAR
jgi:hypothetical protein